MFLKIKISCDCHCQFSVNEHISVSEIICPNCGKHFEYSAKLLKMLSLASELPENSELTIISENEDLNFH